MESEDLIKVLLVDDEIGFLESMTVILARRGFVVDTVRDGFSALEKVTYGDYDAVVLDIKMPGMDGLEVLERLQARRSDTPVILLTGHGSIEAAFRSAKAGVKGYLSKPVNVAELAEQIREAVAAARESARGAPDGEEAPGDAEGIRVLLIDDETDFLESLSRILRRRGMEVATATTGETALEQLAEAPIDVAILDMKMPGIGGRETLERIKKDFSDVEVIVLTGHPSIRDAMEMVKLGADEYIEKPPDIGELAAAIRKLNERRTQGILDRQKLLIEEIRKRYPY